MTWTRCADGYPEDLVDVLVCVQWTDQRYIMHTACFRDDGDWIVTGGHGNFDGVTVLSWHPLPEPPVDAAEDLTP